MIHIHWIWFMVIIDVAFLAGVLLRGWLDFKGIQEEQ